MLHQAGQRAQHTTNELFWPLVFSVKLGQLVCSSVNLAERSHNTEDFMIARCQCFPMFYAVYANKFISGPVQEFCVII